MKYKKLIILSTLICVGFLFTSAQPVQADTAVSANENSTSNNSNQDQNKDNNTQPQTKTCWIERNGQRSYLINDKPVKGLKQIDRIYLIKMV